MIKRNIESCYFLICFGSTLIIGNVAFMLMMFPAYRTASLVTWGVWSIFVLAGVIMLAVGLTLMKKYQIPFWKK